jgi:threonylcarbamoyladenosine tRNA methylthiotransferase MtaB
MPSATALTQTKTVAFYTMGCKTNLLEASVLSKQFEALGWQVLPYSALADLYVFNTCTVTEKADAEARRLIRQLKRRNEQARIAVTGCYVQVSPDTFKAMDGVDFIIGNSFKDNLSELVATHFEVKPLQLEDAIQQTPHIWLDEFEKSRTLENTVAASAGLGRTRGSLKIQDGCDYKCTYCIIWKGRGPSRSLPPTEAVRGLRRLVAEGFHDITLTGINIGQYEWGEKEGETQAEALDLADLLEVMCQEVEGAYKLRLTSLDPLEVTDKLMETVARWPEKIAPHFHLSTQSADDGVLKAMARRHHSADLKRVCSRIIELMPHAAIGSDVIVGFPSESKEAFERTYKAISELPMHYIHVFRYSPRPGTPAATAKPQVPEYQRKERAQRLTALALQKKEAFYRQFTGQTLEVLLEHQNETGAWEGVTPNYLKVLLPANSCYSFSPNTRVSARIGNYWTGEAIEASFLAALPSPYSLS